MDQNKNIQRKRLALLIISAGIVLLSLGYFLLSRGSDRLAPVLIILSFFTLALGISMGWDQ